MGYSRSVIYHLRNTGTELIPSDVPGLILKGNPPGKDLAGENRPRGRKSEYSHEGIHDSTFFREQFNASNPVEINKPYPGRTWLKATLHEGDELTCNILETESGENVVETELPLSIVYEDEDLLVIDKSAGMPIHPSMGHYDDTLANALCFYTHHVLNFDTYVNRIINRLDKNTSGLLISAKNMLSAARLGDFVRERSIHRQYIAICQGDVRDCLKHYPSAHEGYDMTISAPIARKDASVIERVVDFATGDPATTHVKPLLYDSEKDLSLVALKLETGRTHQIRVHMKHIGHPLIGDFLYNPDYRYIKRQALHSRKLSFKHPISGEPMSFTAALPEDMQALFPEFN